jgi:2-dehydro-3-deoxy-D-arabinonate dehydratase
MHLLKTAAGVVLEHSDRFWAVPGDWDAIVNDDRLEARLAAIVRDAPETAAPAPGSLRAPIGSQEVWAAGVTYWRSRTARMEESKAAGGGSFYDRVYEADRPELFFKATPHRVVGPGGVVRVRRDSTWSVPEPELALVVNARGTIVGCTIGNDMSARDIEGENPLYLPQAKVYAGSCALGPGVAVGRGVLVPSTTIAIVITRGGRTAFEGGTTVGSMRRTPDELVEFLYRENDFPYGSVLLTGTGVVPPDDFTLAAGDVVRITIDGIGTLENEVRVGASSAVTT